MKNQFKSLAVLMVALFAAFNLSAANTDLGEGNENSNDDLFGCTVNILSAPEAVGVGPNDGDIIFGAPVSVGLGTTISASTFELRLRSGRQVFLSAGFINGQVRATYNVPCSDPVVTVTLRVNGRNNLTGQACFESLSRSFGELCSQRGTLDSPFNANPNLDCLGQPSSCGNDDGN